LFPPPGKAIPHFSPISPRAHDVIRFRGFYQVRRDELKAFGRGGAKLFWAIRRYNVRNFALYFRGKSPGGFPMFTRREVMLGAVTAGTAALTWRPNVVHASASQPSTPVNFAVPEGACDCHVHTFDPQHFPFSPARPYTPEPVSVDELRSLHKALHLSRVIVVQTTVYGTDNAGALDAMKKLGSRARGVAVIDEKTPDSALDEMDRAGIRGIRLNLETAGQTDPEIGRQRFQTAVERIKNRKWHIQIYARLSVIEGIKDQVAASPMPVVFDHFAGTQAALGIEQPGFNSLVNLLRTGKAYVKISAPYRSSTLAPDYPDVAPIAKALVAANPQRILWGSDWPHPGIPVPGRNNSEITPFFQIDDGQVLNFLPTWVPDAAARKTILVENPAKLYGF
jgi:predicted TIM-barrel fold metal-dependent hydrolase